MEKSFIDASSKTLIWRKIITLIEKAQALLQQNQFKEAEKLLRKILQKQPQNAQAIFLLAQIALNFGAFEDALPLLERCSQLMPQQPAPLLQLANALAETNQLELANNCYQQLIARFNEFPQGFFNYAGLLQILGDNILAKEMLSKTLQLEPTHTKAMLALTGLNRIKKSDTLMKQMLDLLEYLENERSQDNNALMHLNYAIGKAYDDQADFPQAFFHWQAANRLQLMLCNFRVHQMQPFYSQVKKNFDHQLLNTGTNGSKNSLTPIFIVGMPRSGSTLLEQILSSHTEIQTAGEINYIGGIVVPQIESITGKSYPLEVNQLTPTELKALGNSYLNKLQQHHPGCKYIIDKLPANYQSIGLIKLILPDAIIINLTRNPLAISLSVYRNYFAQNEPYFCDLDEFSEYYLAYCDLMKHWNNLIKHRLIELNYEELITHPKTNINKILEICGLPWQDNCLEFNQQSKSVLTLSVNQVNKPLYQSSKNHWENYSQFLSNVKERITNLKEHL